jgi:hypothetical protein
MIVQKKSALQVEGRSAESRAEEFNRLNYLLEYRAATGVISPLPDQNINELELEALALELELELLSF